MKIWKIPFFSFYDTAGMERYLERMAKKGRMLDHIGNYAWSFVRTEPKDVHFTVTYYPKASAFDPEPSEEQLTFEEFCEHSGWKPVASNAKIMVFANEEEDPVPIHTDPETELETLEASSTSFTVSWTFLLVLLLGLTVLNLARFHFNPVSFLSQNLSLLNLVMIPLLALVMLLDLTTWYRWRNKCRILVKEGAELPSVHGYSNYLGILLVIDIGGIVLSLLGESNPRVTYTLLFVIFAIILINLLVNGTRILLKKRQASRMENFTVTLFVDLLLAVLFAVGLLWAGEQFRTIEPTAGDTKPLLRAEELYGSAGSETTYELDTSSSLLLTDRQTWFSWEPNHPEENRLPLQYEILDIHTPFLQNFILNEFLHRYDHYGDYEEDWKEEAPFYRYERIDAQPWDAKAAWRLQAYGDQTDTYLLVWDGRIAELKTSEELNADQIALVAERFHPEMEEQ